MSSYLTLPRPHPGNNITARVTDQNTAVTGPNTMNRNQRRQTAREAARESSRLAAITASITDTSQPPVQHPISPVDPVATDLAPKPPTGHLRSGSGLMEQATPQHPAPADTSAAATMGRVPQIFTPDSPNSIYTNGGQLLFVVITSPLVAAVAYLLNLRTQLSVCLSLVPLLVITHVRTSCQMPARARNVQEQTPMLPRVTRVTRTQDILFQSSLTEERGREWDSWNLHDKEVVVENLRRLGIM